MTHSSKICVSLLIIGFMFVGLGQAQIDPDSILGVWLLDEGQGDTTADASGNGNDGTLMASPDWATGQFGASLDFEGSSSYVDCGNAASLNVDVFSVSFWCHIPATQGWNHMISRGSHVDSGIPGSVNWGVMMYTDQETILYETFNDTGWVGIQAPASAGEWHHLAATLDTTAMQLYVDGQLISEAAGGVLLDEDRSFVIGARSDAGGSAGAHFSGRLDEVGYFNAILTEEDIQLIMNGGLSEILGGSDVAISPQPADGGSDIPRDSALSWMPGVSAHTHDVYLGTDVGAVSNASVTDPQGVLAGQGLTDTALDVGTLAFEQIYYWRVDEVNAAPDKTVFKGNIWSFTVEPKAIPITGITATASGASPDMGPENTVNGSGLDGQDQHSMQSQEMWLTITDGSWIQYEFDTVYKLHELLVWNSNQAIEAFIGFGVKEMTVEYSTDGESWSALDGVVEIPRASGLPNNGINAVIDMGGAMARLVKLSVVSAHGFTGQSGLSEVRFMSIPVLPREPQPADGTTTGGVDIQLSWRSGRQAVTHDVALSSDLDAMVNGTAPISTVSEAGFDTGSLNYGTTYNWQITEVNEAADPTAHTGAIWHFATPEYRIIDGFESYSGEVDEEIFMTWWDGFGGDDTLGGSTTGHIDAPFVETSIVNSGSSAMPMFFDNNGGFMNIDSATSSPSFSEVVREFDGLDLTEGDAQVLAVSFRGKSPEFAEMADGSIAMNAAGADIWNAADEFRFAYKTLTGDGSMVAQVQGLDTVDVWSKAGVMIRDTLNPGSVHAMMVATGTNGVTFQYRPVADAASDSDTGAGERSAQQANQSDEPVWVRMERKGNQFSGSWSLDGVNWNPSGINPQTIDMGATVFVGLAVTSHSTGNFTSAAFSDVSIAGNVAGAWQTEAIGVAMEQSGNSGQDPLYLIVEDSVGKTVSVTHPNPGAVQIGVWQDWLIPVSEFSSLRENNIKAITIGVGYKNGSQAGSEGILYIDDLRLGTPIQ